MSEPKSVPHQDAFALAMAVIERDVETAVRDLARMVAVDTSFPPGLGYDAFADLMTELKEHALQVALQNRERDELLTSGRPHYELPMIPEGIDLASLYQLAAALRDQGAA